MPRPVTIEDQELLNKLSRVFRDVGYYGASVSALSEATGLKKASLYHRFPEGKEQMAREVLATAENWLEMYILKPLRGDAPPAERLEIMVKKLNEFYSGGRESCLLNMLASVHFNQGPFAKMIKESFNSLIKTLSQVISEAGFDEKTSRSRAERAIVLIQGSLVLSRGLGSTKPFRDMLAGLPKDILGNSA